VTFTSFFYCYGDSKSIKNKDKKSFHQNDIKGTSTTKEGIVLSCSNSVPCVSVEIGDVTLTFSGI